MKTNTAKQLILTDITRYDEMEVLSGSTSIFLCLHS